MPAFPHALWPWPKGGKGEQHVKIIQEQAPEHVQKAMNHARSVFAPDADASQNLDTLCCQWKCFFLDFSDIKEVGELSSNVLFAEAQNREVLDCDVIEIPILRDAKGGVLHSEHMLGFKVGCIKPDAEGGGRKVARIQAKKSVLANTKDCLPSRVLHWTHMCHQVGSLRFMLRIYFALLARASLTDKLIVCISFLLSQVILHLPLQIIVSNLVRMWLLGRRKRSTTWWQAAMQVALRRPRKR
jgi:hypothetical protein